VGQLRARFVDDVEGFDTEGARNAEKIEKMVLVYVCAAQAVKRVSRYS
jgi:hypothetical protein